MEPQENARVLEFPTSTIWFDEDGILCSRSKKAPPSTIEESKKTLEEFNKFLNGKKVCMLLDTTNSGQSSKETREFAAAEFPKFTKAIAFFSASPLGKMVANIFFSIVKQPYPVKMFNDEKSAKAWLKQYL